MNSNLRKIYLKYNFFSENLIKTLKIEQFIRFYDDLPYDDESQLSSLRHRNYEDL